MSDPSLLAAVALAKGPSNSATVHVEKAVQVAQVKAWGQSDTQTPQRLQTVQPESLARSSEFSRPIVAAPRSGSQLFYQRLAALRAGRLYTRLPLDSFRNAWVNVTRQPSYEQWRTLLGLEARAVARGQGGNRLAVLVGDSLSLWFPSDRLPSDQLWLNQALSGDTTKGVLNRLSDFSRTRPTAIYIMAGVNDLKQGVSDNEIVWNLRQIVRRLQQAHPQARIVMQSILPTRTAAISSQRIWRINQYLAAIAQQEGAIYLDLYSQFANEEGQLQQVFTTDGLHLSQYGYQTWQVALRETETLIAQGRL